MASLLLQVLQVLMRHPRWSAMPLQMQLCVRHQPLRVYRWIP
jgi:hypothetical protein